MTKLLILFNYAKSFFIIQTLIVARMF